MSQFLNENIFKFKQNEKYCSFDGMAGYAPHFLKMGLN